MRVIFFIIFITMIAFMIGVTMLVLKAFYFIASPTGSKGFKRAVKNVREALKKLDINLIPKEEDTLGLLCAEATMHKKPNFFNPIGSAILPTVYNEPYVAIAYQHAGKNALVIAQTGGKEEIIIKKSAKQTEIWFNDTPFGLYADGALLSPQRRGALLARIDFKEDAEWLPIYIGDKKAAAIANPKHLTGVNPRAFTLINDLSAEEEKALLALLVYTYSEPFIR